MDIQEILLAAFSIISSLIIVFVIIILGWYLVWKFFLSRFKLVRELLGSRNDSPSNSEASSSAGGREKSSKSRKLRKE